ncbi:hypothetical protein HJO_00570 [Hyphomonas johnsonii MHS-2]|uniref:PIN domain-containing protein n=2 Tax=Hyphomonas johnsonii TaxID=81031 RepID=A0A059FT24_9PROT|nr:hypothetical protein HJO_00570 [Hyphomonas johnsonii MHS-2]
MISMMTELSAAITADIRSNPEIHTSDQAARFEVDTGVVGMEAQGVAAVINQQISDYADLISTDPKSALKLLSSVRDKLDDGATQTLRYRVVANIAACYLELGEEANAAERLINAYDIDPENPKASANKALGLLLQNETAKLISFAEAKLTSQSENASLAGYLIQARIGTECLDPLEAIPEALREHAEVQLACVRYYMEAGAEGEWWPHAMQAYKDHQDVPGVSEFYAAALLERTITATGYRYGYILTDEQEGDLREAIQILSRQWSEIKDPKTHTRGEPIATPLNLMVAHRLLGEHEPALQIGQDALHLFPDSEDVKERLAAAYMDAGKRSDAAELTASLTVTPAIFMVRFTAAMEMQDWKTVNELYEAHLDKCPLAEKSIVSAGHLISSMSGEASGQIEVKLTEALKEFESSPRACIALSQFAGANSLNERADQFFNLAKKCISEPSPSFAARMMFAQEAINRGDNIAAASALYGYVDTSRDSSELRTLAHALANEFPVRQRSRDFFQKLPDEISSTPSYQVFEAFSLINAGQLKEAIPLLESAFSSERKLSTLIYLFNAFMRIDDRKSIKDYLDQDGIDDLEGPPIHRITLSQILLEFFEWDRAISIGYDTVCAATNMPNVVMKFCGLVLKPTANRPIDFDGRVAPKCWVKLRSEQGDRYECIIDEEADRAWGSAASSSNTFVQRMLGLSDGDSFKEDAVFGITKTWTVEEVKPRWLQAFHYLSASFSQRFPGVPGFVSFTMKDDDIQPALDQVKRQGEATREYANLYLRDGVPAAIVAGRRVGGAIAFADYLPIIGENLRTCLGSHQERHEAFETIREIQNKGVIVDALTAWRAAELKVFPALKAVLGPIYLPQFELETLKEILEDQMMDREGSSLSMSYENGQYFRRMTTPKERKETLKIHQERLAEIQIHCQTEAVVLPTEMNEVLEQLANAELAKDISPVLIPIDERALLSDDMRLREWAFAACGRKGLWLQTALMVALDDGHITLDEYSDAIVLLAAHRHDYVSVGAEAMLSVVTRGNSDHLYELLALCQFVGSKNAEFRSHLKLVAEFINRLWKISTLPDLTVMKATSIALRALLTKHREKEWALWAAGLAVILDAQPKGYFQSWLRGHFLSVEEVNDEIGKFSEAPKKGRKRK